MEFQPGVTTVNNFSSCAYYRLIVFVVYAVTSITVLQGFAQEASSNSSKASSSGGKHYEAQLSEQLHTDDQVSAKLTLGQRRALANAKDLDSDSAAIFNPDGTVLRKGSARDLAGAFKACKDLQPISDKCWLCKDNGRILCSTAPKLKPESSARQPRADAK